MDAEGKEIHGGAEPPEAAEACSEVQGSDAGRVPAAAGFSRIGSMVRSGEFLRFLIASGWNTLFGYGVYAGFTYLFTGLMPHAYLVAAVLSNILAISNAYIIHKLFVFKTRGNVLKEYLRYYVVYGGTALLNLALLPPAVWLVARYLSDSARAPYIAPALVLPICAVLSFLGHKFFSFRSST